MIGYQQVGHPENIQSPFFMPGTLFVHRINAADHNKLYGGSLHSAIIEYFVDPRNLPPAVAAPGAHEDPELFAGQLRPEQVRSSRVDTISLVILDKPAVEGSLLQSFPGAFPEQYQVPMIVFCFLVDNRVGGGGDRSFLDSLAPGDSRMLRGQFRMTG